MPLTSGSRVGSFVIHAPIGAGGMGEVYLAEDERLRRRVALKVISTRLAMEPVAAKRLLREARAAATLEHPNICTVYEVGEADGRGFIAMQYAEGETLAARLRDAPLELPVAISIGAQIANALAEAHRHGIVHRDVKPQNVMLSATNHVTVLDFGLATVATTPDAASQTATVLTEAGAVSGTLSYMSPEQARGEQVDARSDVFSFGIVFYELLTRVHPFVQDTGADTLAAILTRDPRPVPIGIPSELRRILRKCLEKDRGRRYQSMQDVAIDLETLALDSTSGSTPAWASDGAPTPVRRRPRAILWAGATVLVLAAAAAGTVWWKSRTPPSVQANYEAITDFTDSATAPALSPDGRMITFLRGGSWFLTTTGQIYVKMLPNGEAIQLTDDPRPKLGPVFSADGSRVAYTALAPNGRGVSWDTWTVPISGGTPARLLANAAGLSWIDPRHVLFSEIQPGTTVHMGLVTATEDRRDARQVYLPPHERAMAHYSALSPDRAWVLVVEMGPMGRFEGCRLVPFDGTAGGRPVGPAGACHAAAWSPDQRWMYFSAEVDGASHLWRQRFPDGEPEPLTESRVSEEQGIAVAPDGKSLVTAVGIRQSSLWLHSANGERLLSSEGYASQPWWSADGARLYYLLRRAAAAGGVELRVMNLATLKSDRVLPDFSIVDYAVSRDEQEVAITTRAADGSPEIWVAALDRRTAPRRVAQRGDHVAFGPNRDLVFRSIEAQGNFVAKIGLDGQNRVRLSDRSVVDVVATSRDGQWVIFGGRFAENQFGVIALPVQGGEPRLLCSVVCIPEWSPDGASLYLTTVLDAPGPIVVVPLPRGRAFPEFPDTAIDGMTHWRTLPTTRIIQRLRSIPGLDESTYVERRTEERMNLFRLPLSR
jgi:eukaryotic-like serine/threonine-protein kinase